jgi:hypothetical protein
LARHGRRRSRPGFALAQLVVAIVALVVSFLVLAFNALRRLLKKQNNAILP